MRQRDVAGLDLQFGEFLNQALNVGFSGSLVGQSQALDGSEGIANSGGVGGNDRFIQDDCAVILTVGQDVLHLGGYLEVQPEDGLVNFQQERFKLIAARTARILAFRTVGSFLII
ncbi:hypothetical protein [Marinobacter algicola]|uniref:hypothetical protein n=1 Tax=Marinobacter algicola TaxID=236100 RepID=UPI003BA8C5C7